jgi:hypothetical protein
MEKRVIEFVKEMQTTEGDNALLALGLKDVTLEERKAMEEKVKGVIKNNIAFNEEGGSVNIPKCIVSYMNELNDDELAHLIFVALRGLTDELATGIVREEGRKKKASETKVEDTIPTDETTTVEEPEVVEEPEEVKVPVVDVAYDGEVTVVFKLAVAGQYYGEGPVVSRCLGVDFTEDLPDHIAEKMSNIIGKGVTDELQLSDVIIRLMRELDANELRFLITQSMFANVNGVINDVMDSPARRMAMKLEAMLEKMKTRREGNSTGE